MEQLTVILFEVLAFNLATSGIIFAAVYFSRRKRHILPPLRAVGVFLAGWIATSLVMFVLNAIFAFGGVKLAGSQLESPVSILISIATMYPLFAWLSTKRSGVAD